MIMWSNNYPNYYIPAPRHADYLLPVALDSEYCNNRYYNSSTSNNNIIQQHDPYRYHMDYRSVPVWSVFARELALLHQSVSIRSHRAHPYTDSVTVRPRRALRDLAPGAYTDYAVRPGWAHSDPAPYAVRPRRALTRPALCTFRPRRVHHDPARCYVRPRLAHSDPEPCPVRSRRAHPRRAPCPVRARQVQVLAPREKRRNNNGSCGLNVRVPLQVSKIGNQRRVFRNPSSFGGLAVLAPRVKRRNNNRSRGLNVQVPLQVSKIGNQRRVFHNPSSFRGSVHGRTTCQGSQPLGKGKRSLGFPMRIPLQVSNLPKTRRKRNPSQYGASAFKKRKISHAPTESSFQASAFQKRSHRRVPMRVSNQCRKRSHKFKKWFPLRVSNQWRKRSRRSYACFRCKKQGHFAIRCPQSVMHNKSRLSSSVPIFIRQDGLQYSPPSLICQCGLRCSLNAKKTRKAYTCSLRSCSTFRWEDEVNGDELISVPKCQCGAGFCRQCTESGCKYFACPIKKGQGACTFFKLLNDESLINNRHVESRSLHVRDTAERYPNQRNVSGNQKLELMEVELDCEEDTSNKTLRKCNKRFRDGAPKYDSSSSNTVR